MSDEDDQLRALFTTVGAQQGPPLGFTAESITRRGRRIRVARWGAGVAAGVVAAGAITTAVALTADREVQPGTPPLPGPAITTTDVPTTTPDVPTTTSTGTTTTVTTSTVTTTETVDYTTSLDTPTS